MNHLILISVSLLSAVTLTACLGSSSSSQPEPPPEPPVTGDAIHFDHLGLDQVAVGYMYQSGDSVWVAGSEQIYVSRNLDARNEDQADWQVQLSGAHFTQISGFNSHTLFALGIVQDEAQNGNLTQLYRSVDGGDNWHVVKHNFGNADDDHDSTLQALVPDPATGYLYGVGQDLLAISYDQGDNWEVLHGAPGLTSRNFVLALADEHNDLWWGGQNAIEQSSLHRFSLNNHSHQSWYALFPSPSTVEHIAFDRTQSGRVLIGTEGGIGLSDNYGADWQQVVLHDDATFHMAIVQSRGAPEVWYSGRWQKGQQNHQLTFEYSKDAGYTWQHHRHPATTENYGVRHMILLNQSRNDQDILWLGLQNGQWQGGGVMRVRVDLDALNSAP